MSVGCSDIMRKKDGPTTLRAVQTLIDNGTSLDVIARDYFGIWIRHQRALVKYAQLKAPRRKKKTFVIYLYGEPGTGKSRAALDIAQLYLKQTTLYNIYYKSSGKWWDYYDQDKVVIWDDFRWSSYMANVPL